MGFNSGFKGLTPYSTKLMQISSKLVLTSESKKCVSFIKTILLMLYRKINNICSENLTKHAKKFVSAKCENV